MMTITFKQYANAKRQLAKLVRHQDTVKAWDAALKGYKVPEGQKVVEVQIKDGGTRYVTEKNEGASEPLLK